MNPTQQLSSQPGMSIWKFVWQIPENRKLLLLSLVISLLSFILFKLLYPFPDFISDSYSYLFAAYAHLNVSVWPIGYSKFLSFFHSLTYSDLALVAFQYFFMQFAGIWFFFTILYFYHSNKTTRVLLFLFLFVNPLSLYLCNTINSDALFAALSIFWFAELIWIIHRPRIYQVFVQAVLLLLCFTVRNNAYYYPPIAIITFIVSRHKSIIKWAGSVLPLLLIGLFITWTQNSAKKLTGVSQFSLFTGWQLANNALYIYDQIEVDSNTLPTSQARELNRTTIAYFKHVNQAVYRDYLEDYVGNFFIRQPEAPLKQYFSRHFAPRNEMGTIVAWAKCSAAFEPFGKSIIMHHPFAYFQFFMIPNFRHYMVPPLSHLEKYNYGENDIDPIAKYWFHFPSLQIHCFSHSFQGFLLIYSALFLIGNLYFGWQWISYMIKTRIFPIGSSLNPTYWLITIFVICNIIFSLASTVNILRYQITSMILLLTFASVLSDYLEERAHQETNKVQIKLESNPQIIQSPTMH
jgi:hypothetical protein